MLRKDFPVRKNVRRKSALVRLENELKALTDPEKIKAKQTVIDNTKKALESLYA